MLRMCRILACSDKHSVLNSRYLCIGSQHIRRRALVMAAVPVDGPAANDGRSRTRRYAMHTKGTEAATGEVSKTVEPFATSCRSLCASARNCCALPTGGLLRAQGPVPVSANGGGRPGGS